MLRQTSEVITPEHVLTIVGLATPIWRIEIEQRTCAVVTTDVGAWLYVQFQQVRADRDDLNHRAEIICAGSGTGFAPVGNLPRGQACAAKVAALVKFKAETDQNTARTLADALAAHDARQNADNVVKMTLYRFGMVDIDASIAAETAYGYAAADILTAAQHVAADYQFGTGTLAGAPKTAFA